MKGAGGQSSLRQFGSPWLAVTRGGAGLEGIHPVVFTQGSLDWVLQLLKPRCVFSLSIVNEKNQRGVCVCVHARSTMQILDMFHKWLNFKQDSARICPKQA